MTKTGAMTRTGWDCFVPRNDENWGNDGDRGGNDGAGVGEWWRLRVASNHQSIVIASKREYAVLAQNTFCEAIPSGMVWDCFVPRNDGAEWVVVGWVGL